jgi:hypothetical protein
MDPQHCFLGLEKVKPRYKQKNLLSKTTFENRPEAILINRPWLSGWADPKLV